MAPDRSQDLRLTTSLAAGASLPVRAGESNVRLRGAPGAAVRRAIEGASLRPEAPLCRQAFSALSDSTGRPLQAALDELGHTPESYLRGLVFFHDGSSQGRCRTGDILGGTRPGSRVVYVCPLQFVETYRRDARLGETFVIHETLHSLGLGEDPPSSWQIGRLLSRLCPVRAPIAERMSSVR